MEDTRRVVLAAKKDRRRRHPRRPLARRVDRLRLRRVGLRRPPRLQGPRPAWSPSTAAACATPSDAAAAQADARRAQRARARGWTCCGLGLPWTSRRLPGDRRHRRAASTPTSRRSARPRRCCPRSSSPTCPVTNRGAVRLRLRLPHLARGARADPRALRPARPRRRRARTAGRTTASRRSSDLARLAAHEPGNFVEWYYPRRLTIDVGARRAHCARTTPTTSLGIRAWHAANVDLPLYAFQTEPQRRPRAAAAPRPSSSASKVPFSTLVNREKTYAHLDPLTAAPEAQRLPQDRPPVPAAGALAGEALRGASAGPRRCAGTPPAARSRGRSARRCPRGRGTSP